MIVKFFVSDEPDTLSRPVDDTHQDPPPYDSAEEAVEAIKDGQHGEFGRKYVIKSELTVVAIADRGWELITPHSGVWPSGIEVPDHG